MKTLNHHVYEDSDIEDYASKPVVSRNLRNIVIGAVIFFFLGIAGYAYWAAMQGTVVKGNCGAC
jgi:hypothetical protein